MYTHPDENWQIHANFIPLFEMSRIYACQLPIFFCFASSRLLLEKQGKSEGFDSCDRPSNRTQIGFKSSFVSPCDHEIW